MPTVFSHAAAAVSLATVCAAAPVRVRVAAVAALCAVIPDADVIAFRLGIPYDHLVGHRGLSHSLAFAAALGAVAARLTPWPGPPWWRWLFFSAVTASHGVLDALTDGGLGVAFFAPFSDTRYFLPWRPIEVSPISVRAFLSPRGVTVLASELVWVWVPAVALAVGGLALRRILWRARGRPVTGER
jgi:inner membrane protein